jgi:ABC-type proline/glycine betaine transport system substrate-binding protein
MFTLPLAGRSLRAVLVAAVVAVLAASAAPQLAATDSGEPVRLAKQTHV